MSVTVTKAVFAHSKAKRNARLVLLALASYAWEEDIRDGARAFACPSRKTLATMCNCAQSSVQKELARLVELGEIKDTKRRPSYGRDRSTIEWELLPGVDFLAGASVDQAGGQVDSRVDHADGQAEVDVSSAPDGLTDSAHDLTGLGDDLTETDPSPDRAGGHEQVSEKALKQDTEKACVCPSFSREKLLREEDEAELVALRRQLEGKPDDEKTRRAVETIESRLVDEISEEQGIELREEVLT